MAFLDRLVSDVIKKSTGYNARSFVRAVGGKNMILLGGAAIAGALAMEKMRSSGTATTPGAGPPPPAPPLPPLPARAATPELPPLPPPLPPPPDLVYAIVRTMVAAALADGEMHAEEKELIEKRLGESGLSDEQTRQIRKDLVVPALPSELSSLVGSVEDKEMLYRFAVLVVLSDDAVSDPEKTWLAKFADALAIDGVRRQSIEKEVFDATG